MTAKLRPVDHRTEIADHRTEIKKVFYTVPEAAAVLGLMSVAALEAGPKALDTWREYKSGTEKLLRLIRRSVDPLPARRLGNSYLISGGALIDFGNGADNVRRAS